MLPYDVDGDDKIEDVSTSGFDTFFSLIGILPYDVDGDDKNEEVRALELFGFDHELDIFLLLRIKYSDTSSESNEVDI